MEARRAYARERRYATLQALHGNATRKDASEANDGADVSARLKKFSRRTSNLLRNRALHTRAQIRTAARLVVLNRL